MMRLDLPRCGGKGKQIIHRCRHFKRALIAVTHRAFNPFRVAGTATNHTANFFGKTARYRVFGKAVVIMVNWHIMT